MHKQDNSPSSTSDDPSEQRRNLLQLFRAKYDGRRLASIRRILGGLLIVTGAPVVVLNEFPNPTIRAALTILALIWLALVFPMIRLLCAEWRNDRLTESLQVKVYADAGN